MGLLAQYKVPSISLGQGTFGKQNCSHNLADILQNLAIGLGTIEWKLEIDHQKNKI